MGRDYVLILVSLLLPLLFFNQASALMDYDRDRPRRGDAVVAIDIGNTNSCVAGYGQGRVETMFQLCIPSWVAFTDNGTLLVGDDARDHAAVDPGSAVFGFKRLIGRARQSWHYTEVVQRLIETVPYKLVEKGHRPCVQLKANGGVVKEFYPEQVTAMVIAKLKKVAEAYLGRTVRHAVFTVPVFYDDASRQSTVDAGWLADLSATQILTEPTAAAIAYGLDRKLRDDRFALVLHVGGGTSAANFLTVFDGMFAVYGEHHDLFFGGEDFDQRSVDYFTKLIREKHGKDINNDKEALRKLRAACEHAKKLLSTQDHAQLSVESLIDGFDFSETLTRAKFEELNHDLFLKVVALVDRAMVEDIEKSKVDEIILIGGSTMIPKIQELIRDYFDGKEPNARLKPDEVVTFGAALLSHPTARDW